MANLNGPVVNVVVDMLEPGKFTDVRREDIESMEPARISMMPPGLLNSLKADEIQDLLAYLALSRRCEAPDVPMKCSGRSVGFAALALPFTLAAQGPGRSLPADGINGFVAIFDGKTLNNWDGDPRFWRVEDGMIVAESTPDKPVAVNTFLIWRGGTTGDFEFKVDYRMTANANSGIQYRSTVVSSVGQWAMRGYQADLDGANQYTGQIYEERGRGFIALRGSFVRFALAAGGSTLIGAFGADTDAQGAHQTQ